MGVMGFSDQGSGVQTRQSAALLEWKILLKDTFNPCLPGSYNIYMPMATYSLAGVMETLVEAGLERAYFPPWSQPYLQT